MALLPRCGTTCVSKLSADIFDVDASLDPVLALMKWLVPEIRERHVSSDLTLIKWLNSELDEIDARLDAVERDFLDYSCPDLALIKWLSQDEEYDLALDFDSDSGLAPIRRLSTDEDDESDFDFDFDFDFDCDPDLVSDLTYSQWYGAKKYFVPCCNNRYNGPHEMRFVHDAKMQRLSCMAP